MATFYMTADAEMYHCGLGYSDELYHYGVLGMKWGVRRYQNKDGSLTAAGKKRYGTIGKKMTSEQRSEYKNAKKLIESGKHETESARRLWERYDKKRIKMNKKYKDRTVNVNGKKMALMKEKDSAALYDYERNTKFYSKLYEQSNKKLKAIFKDSRKKYGEKRIKDIKEKDMAYGKKILGATFDKELLGTSVKALSISALTTAITIGAHNAGFFVFAPYVQGSGIATGLLGTMGLLASTTPLKNKEYKDKANYGFDQYANRTAYYIKTHKKRGG